MIQLTDVIGYSSDLYLMFFYIIYKLKMLTKHENDKKLFIATHFKIESLNIYKIK